MKHRRSRSIGVLLTPALALSGMILAWTVNLFVGFPVGVALSQTEDLHNAFRQKELDTTRNPSESSTVTTSQSLKVNVNLVLVPVTVTDGMNRVVLGLGKEHFQVYQDKQLQSVQTFSSADVPVSVGIIFDTSGSMVTKTGRARQAVVEFTKMANPEDEFFLIAFADRPIDLVDFTPSAEEVTNSLLFARPQGSTALLDAIYLGIAKMHRATYTKKALLIISDGGDNHSRYSDKDVKRLVKESDVMIYAIGVYDTYFPTEEERLGPELLSDICDLSGGGSFAIDNPNDLPDVASKIGMELHNQYVLGYRPNRATSHGKWHKIRVKLLAPKGFPQLRVSAKEGYYDRAD